MSAAASAAAATPGEKLADEKRRRLDSMQLSPAVRKQLDRLRKAMGGDFRDFDEGSKARAFVEVARELVLAGHKVYGGFLTAALGGRLAKANDIDVEVRAGDSHAAAVFRTDDHLFGKFPLGLPEKDHKFPRGLPEAQHEALEKEKYPTLAFERKRRAGKRILDVEYSGGRGAIRNVAYQVDGKEKVPVQYVDRKAFSSQRPMLDATNMEMEWVSGALVVRVTRQLRLHVVPAMLHALVTQRRLTLLRAGPEHHAAYERCRAKEQQGFTADYARATGWPSRHRVPAEATTAATVFPREHGVEWVAPLPHTSSARNKQEGEVIKNMLMPLIAAYNRTAPADEQLEAHKCFDGAKADAYIARKGQTPRLEGGSAEVWSAKKFCVRPQARTAHERKTRDGTTFANVRGYGQLTALLLVPLDQWEGTVFYFDAASDVEKWASKLHLSLNPTSTRRATKERWTYVAASHQIEHEQLPRRLSALLRQHTEREQLVDWRVANWPRSDVTVVELDAYVNTARQLHRIGAPQPQRTTIDNRHYDATLFGLKVEFKATRWLKRKSKTAYSLMNTSTGPGGRKSKAAAQHGDYDFWVGSLGDTHGIVLHRAVLRQYEAYLGQGPRGAGHMSIRIYPGAKMGIPSPVRGDAPAWQRLHLPYVFAWADMTLGKLKQLFGIV